MGLIRTITLMVLRIILITLFLTNIGFAQNRSLYLKKAQKQFVKGNIDQSLKTLNRFYNLKEINKLPPSVLKLLGLIYQKKKKFSLSAKLFHLVIKKSYQKEHNQVVRELNYDNLDELKVSDKLLRLYYHLGQNYYYIYSQSDNFSYFNASRTYFRICDKKGHLASSTKRYLDSLNAKLEYVKSLEKTISFYANAGGILFQESVKLVNKSDTNDEIDLISNANGVCIGGGMMYGNIKHGWDLYGCAYTAAAQITNKVGSSVQYKQNEVPVSGFLLSPGYYYRPYDKLSSIGFSIPLFFRQGDFSDTENYTIKAKGQLSAGFSLDAKWGFTESWSLDMRLSNLGATNVFINSVSYSF